MKQERNVLDLVNKLKNAMPDVETTSVQVRLNLINKSNKSSFYLNSFVKSFAWKRKTNQLSRKRTTITKLVVAVNYFCKNLAVLATAL